MQNMPLLILVLLLIAAYFMVMKKKEPFSSSGLAISNPYCERLATSYYLGYPTCDPDAVEKICGKIRRDTIDYPTGNYFKLNNLLI